MFAKCIIRRTERRAARREAARAAVGLLLDGRPGFTFLSDDYVLVHCLDLQLPVSNARHIQRVLADRAYRAWLVARESSLRAGGMLHPSLDTVVTDMQVRLD